MTNAPTTVAPMTMYAIGMSNAGQPTRKPIWPPRANQNIAVTFPVSTRRMAGRRHRWLSGTRVVA